MGFDPVAESVAKGKAQLVLLASDLSAGTAGRMTRLCEAAGLRPVTLPLTQQMLLEITPKTNRSFCGCRSRSGKAGTRLSAPRARNLCR